ncbi:hypothetical protein SDC9_72073 [bioreactor metagenome]|uniref:Uncharacterized protein n=1 Tax=bioreactor metagenome TaxID=1076179 RepID=A0A644YBL7_9ZZZZ
MVWPGLACQQSLVMSAWLYVERLGLIYGEISLAKSLLPTILASDQAIEASRERYVGSSWAKFTYLINLNPISCFSCSSLNSSRLCLAMSARAGSENAGLPPAILRQELPSPSFNSIGLNPFWAMYLKRDDPAIPPPAIIAGTFSTHLSWPGMIISLTLPVWFMSPSVTRLDIGPRGVGSPVTSIPYGLSNSLALGTQRVPRHAPIPILEICLSSSDEITFLSPITSKSLSTVISSQWQI